MLLPPITVPTMSLWELGHRMAGLNPYRLSLLPLTAELKDAFRTLVTEIHEHRLDSSLIYEKYREEHDLDREFYLRTHLETIFEIQGNRRFHRRFLKSVFVEQRQFLLWCEQMEYPKPRFWNFLNLDNLNALYHGSEEDLAAEIDSLTPSGRKSNMKFWVGVTAERIWLDNPTMPVRDLVLAPEIVALTEHYQRDTVQRWVAPLAPDAVRGKRGRPKKAEPDD